MSDTIRELFISDLAAYYEVGLFDEQDAKFLVGVAQELKRARLKYPSADGCAYRMGEEFGETLKALRKEPSANVVMEATQLAAMGCRVAVEGDLHEDGERFLHGVDPHPPNGPGARPCSECGAYRRECGEYVRCCFQCDHEATL